ncbi:Glycogen synthase [Salmonella enterica subsp. enterica serovar Carmel]|uniref:glycosyltransferase family 4 protein n=1 Tax=Salmonella sp. SKLX083931 TaxID=3159988 RepID=UPI000DA3A843|nr:glycosyltransferase family 4 protein [Salmonella enterica subsp. enterica serovar Carmel]MDJ6536212.1 glycosyltransferase family 4 protein [Salmonella enterica]MDJ7565654.1 glycosyltransferase family 4 protein [Salmonella enterica]MDK9055862.1 glycosyltransferase family 4 protein [Salmonella enterica subsp. enterica serovar Jangwani]SQH84232.1 Glycogen synthase [Salmonella enterica subsp. enterica serovar Carmel]
MANRVLYICSDFYPLSTGYSNAFYNFLDILNDYEVDILTTTGSAKLKRESGNLRIYKSATTDKLSSLGYIYNSFSLYKNYKRLARQNNYNLIFIETFDEALFLSLIPAADYSKIIVRIHSTSETEYTYYFPGKKNCLNKFLQQRIIASKVINICSTNSYHNEFMKRKMFAGNIFKICQKNFFTIPNTMELPSLPETVNELNQKIKIVSLGRLNKEGFYQKGIGDLINAIFLLGDNFTNFAECTIIGDGEYFEYCEKIILNFGLETSVKMLRKVEHSELIETLTNSDVVVLPSRFEGMSMFALEALYTKNICLFSDTGGLVDMIPNRQFTYAPQNIEALADVIQKIVKLTPKEIEIEKLRSFNKALEFSQQNIKTKFDKIYKILAS